MTGFSTQFGTDPTRESLPTDASAGRTNFRTSVVQLDRPGDASVFDDKTRREAAEIIARYPEGRHRSALLPMLHLVQSVQGQVSPDGIAFCAEQLGLERADVAAVATFYTMFKRNPAGEYLVSVCTNTLCGMLGGDEIFTALRHDLGVGNNETTADGKIMLEHAECLAACDYAPVITVNYEFFDNQTVGTARNLVSQLRTGVVPEPTRGAPLCTFRQIERQIAGFYDEQALALDAVSSGEPTEVGVKLAVERGESAPSYATRASAEKAEDAAERSSQQPTSAHDAPLPTSAADEAHPTSATDEHADDSAPESAAKSDDKSDAEGRAD
jgi:NADH-quinone oxidoreductase subunit E